MYDFVFFFIYSQQIQKGKTETYSILNGMLIVGITLGIHMWLVYAIYRKIFLPKGEGYANGHSIYPTLVALIVLLIPRIIYNKKRLAKILNRYNNQLIEINFLNSIKVISLMLLPLIAMIILSTR